MRILGSLCVYGETFICLAFGRWIYERESPRRKKADSWRNQGKKIENAQSVVLVDYRGLKVDEVTELRRNYTNAGVDYKVYKNTMMRFAFKEMGLEDFNEYLVGPNAIAFGFDDPVQAAKVTDEFAKKHKNLEIKAGIVDGEIIGIDEIKT